MIAFSLTTNQYLRSNLKDLLIKSISLHPLIHCLHVIFPRLIAHDPRHHFFSIWDLSIKYLFNIQLRSSQSRGIITWRITWYSFVHTKYPFDQSSPFIILLDWPFYKDISIYKKLKQKACSILKNKAKGWYTSQKVPFVFINNKKNVKQRLKIKRLYYCTKWQEKMLSSCKKETYHPIKSQNSPRKLSCPISRAKYKDYNWNTYILYSIFCQYNANIDISIMFIVSFLLWYYSIPISYY